MSIEGEKKDVALVPRLENYFVNDWNMQTFLDHLLIEDEYCAIANYPGHGACITIFPIDEPDVIDEASGSLEALSDGYSFSETWFVINGFWRK